LQGNNEVPVGMIAWYSSSVPPNGWLECNGQSTANYAKLAAIVGPNVPDLRGEFIRGWDHGANKDLERKFGSWQKFSVEDFKIGLFRNNVLIYNAISWRGWDYGENNEPYLGNGTTNIYVMRPIKNDDSNTMISLANETRPRNIALLPCIKY